MRFNLLYISMVLVLFTGCVATTPDTIKVDDKRLIYQSVQEEIDDYKLQGDVLYSTGYYADAAKAYEMVNYYEGHALIPLEKIRSIHAQAIQAAKTHYDRGVKYTKDKKKLALIEFNKVVCNDPTYKDSVVRYKTLKQDPAIEPFLAKLEESLNKALEGDLSKKETLTRVHTAMNELRLYDETNLVVAKAKEVLKKQRTVLIDEAVGQYNKGSFENATSSFKFIQSVYPKDPIAQKYLSLIYAKKEIHSVLQKAKDALKKGDYSSAITFSEKALEIDPHNAEALALSDTAKKEYEKQIPELITKGKELYNQQDFTNAKKVFQSVLLWNADDNTSLTYIKKIDEQLKTIESLK